MTLDWMLFAFLLSADVDRHQTQQIHTVPGLHEVNPILGPAPDNGRTNRYFAVSTAATVALAEAVPEYRSIVLGAATAVHVVCIGNNKRLGLSWGF